jgi:hypothetical protein
MGYRVSIEIGQVVIPKGKIKKCLAALNKLFTTDARFAWVDMPPERGFKSLADVFHAWRYSGTTDEAGTGDFTLDYFDGEKWGDDEELYTAIAPFVKSGATIEVRGEDGERWRYLFEDGEANEQRATITWE